MVTDHLTMSQGEGLFIREYEPADEEGVADVCYRTGYMGETLVGKNKFDDSLLFTSLFCRYYLRFEPEHCFVLVDKSLGKIAGYIIGSLDTRAQMRRFALRMGWLIVLRVLFYTTWRHPESLRAILTMLRSAGNETRVPYLLRDYPAHLHINILPEYQGLRLGSELLSFFEGRALARGAQGIHLRTTNKNVKAIPFYEKRQYIVIGENRAYMWPDEESLTLLFGKRLKD